MGDQHYADVMQVLKRVYADPANIDDELVQSIALPANDTNAAAIFYRVIVGWGEPVNNLLGRLKVGWLGWLILWWTDGVVFVQHWAALQIAHAKMFIYG